MTHFNNAANSWDTSEKIQRVTAMANQIKKDISVGKNLDILDFGCGTGLLGLEFMDNAKSLLGIDNSDGMLEAFNLKVKDLENVSTLNIDLETETLDQKFDLVISSMTFHHLDKPHEVLVKLSKMLNDNGRMLIVDLESEDGTFHPDNNGMGVKHFGFSNEEILSWADKSNCRVEITTIDKIKKHGKEYNLFLGSFRLI